MAILIKGMEMPKDGVYWCEIGVAGDIATITIHGEERKSFPLVPVLEPHGRLIDADKLMKRMWDETDCMISVPATFVRDAPTVIPASEKGEA